MSRERRLCAVEGCATQARTGGFCKRHARENRENSALIDEFSSTEMHRRTAGEIDLTGSVKESMTVAPDEDRGAHADVKADPAGAEVDLDGAVCAVIAAAVGGSLPDRDRELLLRVL